MWTNPKYWALMLDERNRIRLRRRLGLPIKPPRGWVDGPPDFVGSARSGRARPGGSGRLFATPPSSSPGERSDTTSIVSGVIASLRTTESATGDCFRARPARLPESRPQVHVRPLDSCAPARGGAGCPDSDLAPRSLAAVSLRGGPRGTGSVSRSPSRKGRLPAVDDQARRAPAEPLRGPDPAHHRVLRPPAPPRPPIRTLCRESGRGTRADVHIPRSRCAGGARCRATTAAPAPVSGLAAGVEEDLRARIGADVDRLIGLAPEIDPALWPG